MSTVEDAVAPAAQGTQQFAYCSPVAGFRNQLKPMPDQPVVQAHGTDRQVVQGYPEAVVSAAGTSGGKSYPNVLQYLCRDTSPAGGYTVQPFAQGQYRCNGAAVIAQNTMGVPGNVNCFWIDETGAMRMAWMTGPSSWGSRSNPPDPSSVPNKYNPKTWNTKLGTLHVAYTPATANGGGRNPVIYAAQGGNALVTVKWDGASYTWTTTVYDVLGGGLDYNDLALVPTSETGFDLIANVTKSSDLGLWTGTFGSSGSLSRNSSAFPGNPSGWNNNGSLRQIIAGSNSATSTACAFYTDDSSTLMMWPAAPGFQRPSPIPVTGAGTTIGAAQLSGTGSRINLYFATLDSFVIFDETPPDGDVTITSTLWFLPQLFWALDGQLPFFAPPSQVTQVSSLIAAVAPVEHPAELAALFAVRQDGRLLLYWPDAASGTSSHTPYQTSYGTNEWVGGPVNANQALTVDIRSYS